MGSIKSTKPPLSTYNQALTPFCNKHLGETAIILGNGPTAKKYNGQIEGVHIGMKASLRRLSHIEQPYYFFGDYNDNTYDDITYLKCYNGIKFALCMVDNQEDKALIPLRKVRKMNAIPLELSMDRHFIKAIDKYCLYKKATIICACQFAFWAGFKNIYIVGADCDRPSKVDEARIYVFKLMAEFAKKEYPEVNVYSVNPVKLKGLFNDVYI